MISIVIGTNRDNAYSEKLASIYFRKISNLKKDVQIIDLKDLPIDFLNSVLYKKNHLENGFDAFQSKIDASSVIIFIIPEYNASFPGVLKVFIDALRYPDTFKNKEILLVGISAGRTGAKLPLNHFKDIMDYLGANTFPITVNLSGISLFLNEDGFSLPEYEMHVDKQLDAFFERFN